jgi:hypothetical protein
MEESGDAQDCATLPAVIIVRVQPNFQLDRSRIELTHVTAWTDSLCVPNYVSHYSTGF